MHDRPLSKRLSASLLVLVAASCVAGCAHLAVSPVWGEYADLPDRSEVIAGQLVIHADFPLAGQHRLVRDLETLRSDVSQELGLPVQPCG